MKKRLTFYFNSIGILFFLLYFFYTISFSFIIGESKHLPLINGIGFVIFIVGLIIILSTSFLDTSQWHKFDILDEEIKKTRDRYEDNELFIKALKRVVVRKSITLEEIEEEKEKLKSKS